MNQIVSYDIGTVAASGTLHLQDIEIRAGGIAVFRGTPINIYPKTIIENGANVTFQSP